MEKVLTAEFENELEDQFDDGFVSREEKAVLHMNLNYNIRKNSKFLRKSNIKRTTFCQSGRYMRVKLDGLNDLKHGHMDGMQ